MTIALTAADASGPAGRVAVIILTWNGLEDTKRCLDSVLRHTPDDVAEIVVVDNGSTDGTPEYLRSLPRIRTLFNSENLGFVRGNNVALRLVDGEQDVILLNNDTLIHDPSWIEKLRQSAYRATDIGIVGCRIRRLDTGMLQHAGTYVPDRTFWGQQIGAGEKDINQCNADSDVEGVVFACVYLKAAMRARIGMLDEDYFSYFEDTDYCFKAREAGFRTINCGSLTIEHIEHGSTTANRVSHSEMFLTSQRTFLGKWRKRLDERYVGDVQLHSTFTRPVGYAMTARQIAVRLDELGVRVAYDYLYGARTVFPVDENRDVSSGNYRIEVIKQRPEAPSGAPRLIYGQADAFDTVRGEYRIGYTMLETTGVPQSWVDGCNRLNEVWVPSPFNEWTFARSGVTAPIRVMPLGLIDTHYFNPEIEGYPLPGVFTFLSIFEWGERKSPETLLRAFNRAFRADDQVVLICRFSNHDPGVDPEQIIRSLRLDPRGGRIVLSQNEPIPYYQMGQIYRSADCFVLPTRGEGWGMPILEAMACGLPVIASYWSAQQLFLTDANSYPLQVRLVDAEAKCPYYVGFRWAEPDEDHLVTLLRQVYENPQQARAKGTRAARDVAEKWSLTPSVTRMRDRIVEVGGQLAPTHGKSDLRPRVAIDVSRAVGVHVSGVGRFTADLVRGLSRRRDALDYLLLPGFKDFVDPSYVRGSNPLIQEVDSDVTLYRGPLPAFADADHEVPGINLLYCTANSFVQPRSASTAMVVYDTTFTSHPQYHTDENIALCSRNFELAARSDCHFVAISESSRLDVIRHFGVAPERVTTIHCGIDLDFFRPPSRLARAAVLQKYALAVPFFLYVGSLEPRKNLRTLLHAIVRYTGPEHLVVVGGAGWMNSEVHDLIRAAGDRVRVLGYVPQEDLPALYGAARGFLYPSVYEGFGLPVVEAMACGTPVLTSSGSSLTEIAEGAALLLENPLDASEMVVALEQLAQDEALRSSLVTAGAARAKTFSLEKLAERHVSLFTSLIESAHAH